MRVQESPACGVIVTPQCELKNKQTPPVDTQRAPLAPVNELTKAQSSQNALSCKLCPDVVVFANEDRAAFQKMFDSYVEQWQPVDHRELDLVADIVQARWSLSRTLGMETAIIDREMEKQREVADAQVQNIDEPTRHALAYTAASIALEKLDRYEAHLRRKSSTKLPPHSRKVEAK